MDTLLLPVLVLIIVIANYYFTGWFIRYAKLRRIADIPTARSSHETPTPRGGGAGFVGAILIAFLLYLFFSGTAIDTAIIIFGASCTVITLLGWFDDKHNLTKRVRFGIQLLAAVSVFIFISNLNMVYIPFAGHQDIGLAGGFLALLWITGATNIYNFMDGVDGIASVQALGAAGGWLYFAWLWELPVVFVFVLFLIVAVSVFLVYNWAPAKIFMGDVGSLFLGFVFAVMPFFAASRADAVTIGTTIWLAALLLWPFLFDGAYTIFRRLSKEENIFEAHRSHLYQRLNIAGWRHHKIAGLYLIFSLVCVILAVLFYNSGDLGRVAILASLVVLSALFVRFVSSVERHAEEGVKVEG